MLKMDIARHRAEQRDARSDQHRHACDDQPVDKSGRQEALDGAASKGCVASVITYKGNLVDTGPFAPWPVATANPNNISK
jgi:hypothetical protein